MTNFVIATAGHVDHGKSALVKALTGTDPDRLPEEKARQITIDLGFAHLDLTNSRGETIRVGIVDVPGHGDFVRNMIAGVGAVDLALFVVAADDGWMPQTEEHLQILSYLGIMRGIIALTKADLGDVAARAEEIQSQLDGTSFAHSPIVPTSVVDGMGLENLKQAIAEELSQIAPPRDIGKPRLFVDRAFTLQGIGTVTTGTLSGGALQAGQKIAVQPRQLEARIRSVQSYGQPVEVAQPGARTALNLPELEVGESHRGLRRGDVITTEQGVPSPVLDVLLERSARLRSNNFGNQRVLKSGAVVDLHYGTSRLPARVHLSGDSLGAGESALAQLRLDEPVFAFLGDHFVVRDRSQQQTLAGGVVLDPEAGRFNFRSPAQQKFLTARARAWHDPKTAVVSEIERAGWIATTAVLQKSNFSRVEIAGALQSLARTGAIKIREPFAIHQPAWETLLHQAAVLIDEFHSSNSGATGMDLNHLRSGLGDPPVELFDALRAELETSGFHRTGQNIARRTHQATLPPPLQAAADRILATLSANPSDPPATKPADAEARQALRFLVEQGSVVGINAETVLLRESFERMKSIIVDFIQRNGAATVSELRQELQTSRRVLVPFLERLDRERITKRAGDRRVLV